MWCRNFLAAGVALVAGAGSVLAQEGAESAIVHAVQIRAGSCADLGAEPIFELEDATPRADNDDGDRPAPGTAIGGTDAIPVAISVTDIDASLDELVGLPHAIAVYEGGGGTEAIVACGEIGGLLFADNELLFGLREQNNSDHAGIAVLMLEDDREIEVKVYVASPGAVGQVDGSETGGAGTDDNDDDGGDDDDQGDDDDGIDNEEGDI